MEHIKNSNIPKIEEIQRIHDIISYCLIFDLPIIFKDKNTESALVVVLQTLCWILGHKSGTTFIENIEAELASQGIVFIKDIQK